MRVSSPNSPPTLYSGRTPGVYYPSQPDPPPYRKWAQQALEYVKAPLVKVKNWLCDTGGLGGVCFCIFRFELLWGHYCRIIYTGALRCICFFQQRKNMIFLPLFWHKFSVVNNFFFSDFNCCGVIIVEYIPVHCDVFFFILHFRLSLSNYNYNNFYDNYIIVVITSIIILIVVGS